MFRPRAMKTLRGIAVAPAAPEDEPEIVKLGEIDAGIEGRTRKYEEEVEEATERLISLRYRPEEGVRYDCYLGGGEVKNLIHKTNAIDIRPGIHGFLACLRGNGRRVGVFCSIEHLNICANMDLLNFNTAQFTEAKGTAGVVLNRLYLTSKKETENPSCLLELKASSRFGTAECVGRDRHVGGVRSLRVCTGGSGPWESEARFGVERPA